MKYLYEVEIEETFKEKLISLISNNKQAELYVIRLELLYSEDKFLDIPIDRIRKCKKGNIFCESIVGQSKFSNVCFGEKQHEVINFTKIILISITQERAAHSDRGDYKLDLSQQKEPITILSVYFKTDYPEAIKDKSPGNPDNEQYYLIHDKDKVDNKDKTQLKANEVIFYTDKHFSGKSYTYKKGDRVAYLNELNDKFNSIKVGSGCKVALFRDVDFKGPSKTVLSATSMADINIDGLSSFIIT